MNEQELPERSRVVRKHLADAGIDAQIRQLPTSTRTAAEAADAPWAPLPIACCSSQTTPRCWS